MGDPPTLPMEVIAQIIPHLKLSTRKSTSRGAACEKFHQKDLTTLMRVSRSVQDLTAKHLYGEIVVNNLSKVILGHDQPGYMAVDEAGVSTSLNNTVPVPNSHTPSVARIHKQDLLKMIESVHFTYSKAAGKHVREMRQSGTSGASMSNMWIEASNFDRFEIWVDRMGYHVAQFFPNLRHLTYSTWQLRPHTPPLVAALALTGPEAQHTLMHLQDAMADKVHSRVRPNYIPESQEKAFGGAGQGLEATHICRIHCEGPTSKRLSRPFVPGKVKKNVVHNWDLVEVPHLVLGADNHIIVHRLPNIPLLSISVGAAYTMGSVLFHPFGRRFWREKRTTPRRSPFIFDNITRTERPYTSPRQITTLV